MDRPNENSNASARVVAADQLEEPFPRIVLIGAAILISITFMFAYLARQHEIGSTRMTPAAAVGSIEFRFVTREDGTVAIHDVQRNTDIKTLSPQSDGFIKIVMKSLAHERKVTKVDLDAPVRLSHLVDGQTILEDLATGRIILISAFGWGNKEVFAELLNTRRE